jgi:hypothetical protein
LIIFSLEASPWSLDLCLLELVYGVLADEAREVLRLLVICLRTEEARAGPQGCLPFFHPDFNALGLHAALAVKMIKAPYCKAGLDRLLNIVLVRDLECAKWCQVVLKADHWSPCALEGENWCRRLIPI